MRALLVLPLLLLLAGCEGNEGPVSSPAEPTVPTAPAEPTPPAPLPAVVAMPPRRGRKVLDVVWDELCVDDRLNHINTGQVGKNGDIYIPDTSSLPDTCTFGVWKDWQQWPCQATGNCFSPFGTSMSYRAVTAFCFQGRVKYLNSGYLSMSMEVNTTVRERNHAVENGPYVGPVLYWGEEWYRALYLVDAPTPGRLGIAVYGPYHIEPLVEDFCAEGESHTLRIDRLPDGTWMYGVDDKVLATETAGQWSSDPLDFPYAIPGIWVGNMVGHIGKTEVWIES